MFDSFFLHGGAFCDTFGLQDPSRWLRNGILLRNGGLGFQIGGLRPQMDTSWAFLPGAATTCLPAAAGRRGVAAAGGHVVAAPGRNAQDVSI